MDLTVLTEYYFYFIGRCRDIMFPRKPWTVWTTPEVTEDETSTSRTPQMSEISNDDDDQFLLDVASKNSPSRYLVDDTIEISSDESSEPKQSKASVINSIFGGPKSKNSTNSFSKWSKHGNDSNTKYGSKPEFNRKKSWKDYKMESPIKFEEHIKMEETMNAKLPQQSLSIGSVEVHFPVKPYSCQVALMFKVITGISKGQNCLLESPTGSGKTLALLCGALAWQKKEKSRIAAIVEQQYFNNCGDITCEDGADWRKTTEATSSPVKPFTGTAFGVQDTAKDAGAGGSGDFKRPEPQPETDPFNDLNDSGLVKIHKRRKLGDGSSSSEPSYTTTPEQRTPEKNQPACPDQQTPKNLRVPTIYYGARTHKQIQQVIKEFKRTEYCGTTKITILSSREYSCIKKLDKNVHSNKNDMCRDCLAAKTTKNGIEETGCTFYNNRRALCHSSLPLAWDLDELVSVGEELHACPYYAARNMMEIANIVFCPYNYLIDPGIRSAMMINLKDEIVILDEAHNIEDICRDTASLTVTRVEICKAMDEINNMGIYEMGDLKPQLVYLGAVLKAWDNWFNNQAPLLQQSVVNFGESVYTWQVQHFATTLDNHNIGGKELSRFAESVGKVSSVFREDPKRIQGISGVTITLLESMITTFNFMFRNGGLFLDDFKPSLVKTVSRTEESLPDSMGWKSSQYKQQAPQEALSLRLLCMNPAVVFSALEPARTVILSSGTLTPALSMHSELGCKFPLELSTKHVIPHDRVWIGSLLTCPDGEPLECTSRGSDRPSVQDALGRALLWVSQVTPNGVLCFVPSYMLMNKLVKRWQDTKLWQQLNQTKYVFMESRNVRDHNDIMEDYYSVVESEKGALLIAVYRGKVSEGMDFKDKQARAVVTIGIPYPNTYESMVSNKMKYNDAHRDRQLLPGREWLRVQAYRALNQAVGRCVRHKNDWGAVLLIDTRFQQPYYTEHLSKWVRNFLGDNHHSWDSLVNSPNSLESFMQSMTIRETEEQA